MRKASVITGWATAALVATYVLWQTLSQLNWEVIVKYLPKLLEGAALTVELVAFAVIAGLILALPLGIARASRHWYVRALPYGYIFFFRGTPLLVQLFLVYYGLAQFDIVRQGPLWQYLRDPYWCTVITMTLHTAAYIAEIIRGAIQAVPPGEIEAARALGMSRAQAMIYIILPRAARIGLPAYSNEVILMLKASALASTVTLLELTGMSRTIIARTYLPVEIFFAAGLFYLVIAFVMVRAFRLLERKLRVDACQGR
ncbi:MAG: ABC transporter permease [Pseudomonas sp.]